MPVDFSRKGAGLFSELRLIWRIAALYRQLRPDIVHHVALKPIVFGSIAARIARVPGVVNAIAGLGYVFASRQLKARLLRPFLRQTLKFLLSTASGKVIVQNRDDLSLLIDNQIAHQSRVVLIRGSGVNTAEFIAAPEAIGVPLIVLPARMLWDKGVGEFVEAARALKESGVRARFALVGAPDPDNYASVSEKQLRRWQTEGVVEWWGQRKDMPSVYSESAIVCLPSYREGLPKSLLEAAASGRAIVATDAPGCREIVLHGKNGLLVPVRDVAALATALKTLIEDTALRARMGRCGRELVEKEFTIDHVVQQTLKVYQEMLA
jgi:glycosyltransferase involved in cell wall biosynthesis